MFVWCSATRFPTVIVTTASSATSSTTLSPTRAKATPTTLAKSANPAALEATARKAETMTGPPS